MPVLVSAGCEPTNTLLWDFDGNEVVEFADFLVLSNNFGSAVDQYDQGDADCNGEVNFSDFLQLSENFGLSLAAAGSQPVPEPTSRFLLTLPAILLMCGRKREREDAVRTTERMSR